MENAEVTPPGTVVGAAIVHQGRLLAARRTRPPRLAGGWELPGGKVEPGETLAQACVREIREELGLRVRAGAALEDAVPVGPGWVLRAVWCELDGGREETQPASVLGELRLTEHDMVRWLMPEELDEIRWLEGDRPFLPALRSRLLDGTALPGGNVGGAIRIGDTVRRPVGPWTDSVHELLEFLAEQRLDGVPPVLGRDGRDRETLGFLPGRVVYTPERPMTDAQLSSVVRWLRRFHATVAGFRPTGTRRWRFEDRALDPGEIVCHHDVGWYNLAFTGDRLTGVFDWDVAGPGVPLDDLAFLAWNDVPLLPVSTAFAEAPSSGAAEAGLAGLRPAAREAARRLRLIATTYGGVRAADIADRVPVRIGRSRRMITAAAEAGDEGMRRLVGTGVLGRIDLGLAGWPRLRAALRDSSAVPGACRGGRPQTNRDA